MSDDRRTDDTDNALNEWNRTVISEFRGNEGRVGGRFAGATLLLLHTTGARSGIERVNPLVYLEDEGRIYVFASMAGADRNPDWFHNLIAHHDVTIELGATTTKATAVRVEGSERDRVFLAQKERHPGFAEYEAKTTRVIPVIELRPA
jgi:deazaflavin-dependent oxidoreductase (nitroreductase family)